MRILLFFCLVMASLNVWAKGDADAKEEPYRMDSLPASYSHEEQKATENEQDKKEQQKREKMRAAALKKADDFFGKSQSSNRAPENEPAEEGSPSAGD